MFILPIVHPFPLPSSSSPHLPLNISALSVYAPSPCRLNTSAIFLCIHHTRLPVQLANYLSSLTYFLNAVSGSVPEQKLSGLMALAEPTVRYLLQKMSTGLLLSVCFLLLHLNSWALTHFYTGSDLGDI